MKNREIAFIVRLKDNAKAAIKGLGGSFVDLARRVKEASAAARAHRAEMSKTTTAAMGLRNALAGVAAYVGVREIVKAASDWGTYANKLRQVTEDEEAMKAVREQLYDVSQRSLAPLEGAVNLYSRASVALNKYGATGDDVLRFTETFSKALTLGGATGGEAASATLQFSQALASGTLRGEEFNAVNEASQRTMRVLADYLGKDTGQLRAMAMQGQITGKVMYEAFMAAGTQIDAEFGKFTLTFDTMMTLAGNAFTRFVGRIDEATGIQKAFSDIFKYIISDGLPQLETAILSFIDFVKPAFAALVETVSMLWTTQLGVIMTVGKAVLDAFLNIGKAIGLIDKDNVVGSLADGLARLVEFATVAMSTFVALSTIVAVVSAAFAFATGAVSAFTVALLANPLTSIITALSIAVGALYAFRDATVEVGGQTATLGQVVRATWDYIIEQTQVLAHNISGTWGVLWRKMELTVAIAVEMMLGKLAGVGEAIAETASAAGAALTLNFDAAGKAIDRAGQRMVGFSTVSEGKLKDLQAMFDKAGDDFVVKPDVDFGQLLQKITVMDHLEDLLKEKPKIEVPVIPVVDPTKPVQPGGPSQKEIEEANKKWEAARRDAEQAAERIERNRLKYIDIVADSMSHIAEKYAPWMEAQRKNAELQKVVTEIDQARTMGLREYEAALKKAGLTEEQLGYLRARAQLDLKEGKTVYDEIRLAALRYVEDTSDGMSLMSQMADSAIGSMGTAFEQFVMTGKLNMKSLVSSILADLAKLAAQNAFKQLLSVFSGGQTGGGGDIFSMIGSAIFGTPTKKAHTGGIVGGALAGTTKVHPMVFAGAKRFHTGGIVGGLKSGERPIIAKDGEAVMPTVRMPDGSYGIKATGAGGGGGMTLNFMPTIQITVEKAENDGQAQAQGEIISREVEQGLRSMVREEIYKAAQPGGVGNWRPQ